jgi:hypothetical protein
MSGISKFNEITVWGLKKKRHSHRFIHQGFYENLFEMKLGVNWLEDSKRNKEKLSPGGLLLASGVAARNLPMIPNGNYILHNIDLTTGQKEQLNNLGAKVLNLQVYTNQSKGTDIWNLPFVKLDIANKTLYQPWGVPIDKDKWQPSTDSRNSKIEYWVGAIWNNQQNQGNQEILREYGNLLSNRNIELKRVGGSRISLGGLSDVDAAIKIRKSPIGATIVGNWQREVQYIPCRLFKNIAAGVAPATNLDVSNLLGNDALYSTNIGELIEMVLTENAATRKHRLSNAQALISPYTYKNAISRIIDSLDMIN